MTFIPYSSTELSSLFGENVLLRSFVFEKLNFTFFFALAVLCLANLCLADLCLLELFLDFGFQLSDFFFRFVEPIMSLFGVLNDWNVSS